jgi:hypothetical protein
MLRAWAKEITGWQAAEIPGISDRHLQRMGQPLPGTTPAPVAQGPAVTGRSLRYLDTSLGPYSLPCLRELLPDTQRIPHPVRPCSPHLSLEIFSD